MDFRHHVTSNIKNLESIGSNINATQLNIVMQNGFLAAGEQYGFYKITLSWKRLGAGPRSNQRTFWYCVGAGLTAGLSLLTNPIVEQSRYELRATLEFFDVHNVKIAEYSRSSIFDGNIRLNRTDFTFSTQKHFSDLITGCLLAAKADEVQINNALVDAKYPQSTIETVARNAFDNLRSRIPPCSDIICSRIAVISASTNSDVIAASMHIENIIINTNGYHAVDRRTIDLIIAELMFGNSAYVAQEDALRVGRMASANYLIIVDVAGEGVNRVLNFRVLNVERGTVLDSFNSRFRR